MRIFILMILCLVFFQNCKEKKTKKTTEYNLVNKEKSRLETTQEVTTEIPSKKQRELLIKGFEICDFEDGYKSTFEKLIVTGNVETKTEFKNRFCYGSEERYVKELFKTKNVECIKYKVVKKYRIFEINYKNKTESLRVYEYLKNIKETEENNRKYFSFFKRGLLFILEEEKLIMISYNPFLNNNLDKELKNHFLNNKEKYNKVLIVKDILSTEELVNF